MKEPTYLYVEGKFWLVSFASKGFILARAKSRKEALAKAHSPKDRRRVDKCTRFPLLNKVYL